LNDTVAAEAVRVPLLRFFCCVVVVIVAAGEEKLHACLLAQLVVERLEHEPRLGRRARRRKRLARRRLHAGPSSRGANLRCSAATTAARLIIFLLAKNASAFALSFLLLRRARALDRAKRRRRGLRALLLLKKEEARVVVGVCVDVGFEDFGGVSGVGGCGDDGCGHHYGSRLVSVNG
jgi:hypothetical protein